MGTRFTLLNEVTIQDRLLNVYLLTECTQQLSESVADLADKLDSWLSNDTISKTEVGDLVAGLDVLTGPSRSVVTADDFKEFKIHPDIRNIQRLNNVDLNSTIRSHIMKVGSIWGKKTSNDVENLTNTDKGRSKIKDILSKFANRIRHLQSVEVKEGGASGPSAGISLKDRWAMKQEQRLSPGVETTGVNNTPIKGHQRREW